MAHKVSHRLRAAATGVYVDPGCRRSTAILNDLVERLTPPDDAAIPVRFDDLVLGDGNWDFAQIRRASGFVAYYRLPTDFAPDSVHTIGDIRAVSLYPCDRRQLRGVGKLFTFTTMEVLE